MQCSVVGMVYAHTLLCSVISDALCTYVCLVSIKRWHILGEMPHTHKTRGCGWLGRRDVNVAPHFKELLMKYNETVCVCARALVQSKYFVTDFD